MSSIEKSNNCDDLKPNKGYRMSPWNMETCVCVFYCFFVLLFCRDSCQKGWRLLYILTAFYRCSEVLKPFLLKFLRDVCKSPEVLFHGIYTLKWKWNLKSCISKKEIESLSTNCTLKIWQRPYCAKWKFQQILFTLSFNISRFLAICYLH